jgi:glycosyltransferase involved in cell wall biosynthesis
MIFTFLKYIRPTWYFNLSRKNQTTVFPLYDSLPKEVKNSIDLDVDYFSEISRQRDASWQAFQRGYIGHGSILDINKEIPLVDEYRFVRKYHKSFWATYCLLMRLITFHNPFAEIKAWFQTKSVQHHNLFKEPITSDWEFFQSDLLQKKPKLSVIIPTLNRYTYLKEVLHDLEGQDYENFEVIVIDQSEPFAEVFYEQFELDIKVRYQEEKALWLARNTAIQLSEASYFLLFDDDSRVASDWISNHLKGLDLFNADISSGQSISKVGQELPPNYRYFRVSDLLDTGNVLIKRTVFETIGLFDQQFEKQRMGDGEFGLRAYLEGFLNISNPYATRLHLKVSIGGLRQMGSWDAFRSRRIFAPKPIPSVLYLYRKYFGLKLTVFELVKSLPPSVVPYQFKRNRQLLVLGVVVSILLIPLLFFQVLKSWFLASEKLKQGGLIKLLDKNS